MVKWIVREITAFRNLYRVECELSVNCVVHNLVIVVLKGKRVAQGKKCHLTPRSNKLSERKAEE